jgi:hypothetical protein
MPTIASAAAVTNRALSGPIPWNGGPQDLSPSLLESIGLDPFAQHKAA